VSGPVAGGRGVRHLAILGRRPRPAGGDAERDARRYAAETLEALGFQLREERFAYSAFPGRYGTPIGGVAFAIAIAAASVTGLFTHRVLGAAIVLGAGIAITGLFARWMLRGVLTLPWMRREGINLAATHGSDEPRVWLVAHLDSKSQPVPSAVRVGGVLLLVAAALLACAAIAVTLAGLDARTIWCGALIASVAGALPVAASVVGERSDGAVDNASGVAAVLAAAALLERTSSCGVLLPSAEELGLAGARAWAKAHAASTAINCDGVDDDGDLVIMHNGRAPADVVAAIGGAGFGAPRVRRMPLGLMTDSTALSAAGWRAVTVSHGSLATLRRVHTSKDTLAALRGTAIDDVAVLLARAAEALAR
jgi:hypothetical protein